MTQVDAYEYARVRTGAVGAGGACSGKPSDSLRQLQLWQYGISVICARNACDLCPVAYNCIRMHLYTFHCIAFNINCIYHWMHCDALNYIYN